MDEFDFIGRYLKPLAGAGALGLSDDVAQISVPEGRTLITSVDSYVEGVHFPQGRPVEKIVPRILPAAVSDIVAKGGVPTGYLMSFNVMPDDDEDVLERFCMGLRVAQAALNIELLGGDTVRAHGPRTITFTVFGHAERLILRSGAQAGDDVWVTGTIGDAFLGLTQAEPSDVWREAYDRPIIRTAFGRVMTGFATASADVSDGLIADLGHIAKASGVGMDIRTDNVPLSVPSRHQIGQGGDVTELMTGGDDYEIIFTARPEAFEVITDAGSETHTPVTKIGTVTEGQGVRCLGPDGAVMPLRKTGYRHF